MDQPSEHESLLANPLHDDQFNTDYTKTFNPLTQATQLTASLSQLPSVASSVFSSFSSILRGNSPTPNTSNDQQQTDAYKAPPALVDVPLIQSSLSYQSEETAVPAIVPTFYSAQDLPPAPTFSPPPPNSSSSNAYRLTTKRKIYAPAPGLSHQDNQSAPSAFPSHAPPLPYATNEPHFQVNPTTFQDTAVNQQPPSQNNKFSLTSFFATPLLEKITGSSSSHTQETPTAAVPEVFAVQSTNPVAPATTVNPGFYGTQPVSEYIQPTFPAEQQPTLPLTPPLFFNPVQQQNLTTANQSQSSVYGTIESLPNISSIPPSSVPPSTIPASGNISNYRLRGKPHYKNPLTSTATTTPLVIPFPQATSSPAPSVGIFNPVNLNRPSDSQVESNIGTGNTGHSIHSSGFTQQLPPPNVSFFNQPQSVPVEPSAPPFNQFDSNNSGNVALANDFPTSCFDPFGRETFLQPPSIPTPQLSHTQATQLPIEQQQSQLQLVPNHPFELQQQPNQFIAQSQLSEVQPAILQSADTPLVEDTKHGRRSAAIHYPIPSLDQAQLPLPLDLNQQQSEQVQETSQLQQLFQPQPTQIPFPSEVEQPTKELSAIPLQQPSFANPFAEPTSHAESTESQRFYQSSFTSDIFNQVQPQDLCSTQHSSTASSELNLHSQVKGQNSLPEEILDSTQAQLSNFNLHREESSGEATSLFQGNTTTANLNQQIDIASTDCKNSSTFDNFFNTQTSQQSERSEGYPEPVAAPLASSFFATTPSNSSQTDWFASSKTVEPSIKQLEGDINRNTQASSESETQDASNFFATTNKNQTSSQHPNYFQIQNFFNNPPLIADSKVQDNNFNFIENNLINKRLHNLTHKASTETDGGSISSNIVEPPSSAQSEFSEFNPETAQSDEYLGEPQV